MLLSKINSKELKNITIPLKEVRKPSINGWILLNPDVSHLKNVILRAEEFGINHLQISHGIVHTASSVLTENWRAKRVNLITEMANKKGIQTYLWTHEFDNIPSEFLDKNEKVLFDDEKLWNYLTTRYKNIFNTANFNGLVLTFQETQKSVYHDKSIVSNLSRSERVTKLVNFLYKLCKDHNKDLVVRSFCYTNDETKCILEGLKHVSPEIIIMIKCQPADWNPYLPHDSLIQHFAQENRGFVVEFDLGEEYHGQSSFPYICNEYNRYRLNYMLNQQFKLTKDKRCGAVVRIERYSHSALGSLNELNLKTFSAIMCDPLVDSEKVYKKELQIMFDKWADDVAELLSETFDIVNAVVYPIEGIWGFMMHNAVADYIYIHDSLVNWPQIGEWINDEYLKKIPQLIVSGDEETIKKALIRLNFALNSFDKISQKLQCLSKDMPCELFGVLAENFRKLEAYIKINIAHHRTYLYIRYWENNKNANSLKKAEAEFADFKEQVIKHGCVLNHLKTEGVYLNRKGIKLFIEQCEMVLKVGTEQMLAEVNPKTIEDFTGPFRYDHSNSVIPG